jgi:hypothetical protein
MMEIKVFDISIYFAFFLTFHFICFMLGVIKRQENRTMKLHCIDTGKWTLIKNNEFGEPDISAAADRLVARENPGYFASRAVGWDNLPDKFNASLCRSIGDLTEHTGERYEFRIER